MNKILNPPRSYVMFIIWLFMLIFILLNVILSDTSTAQSNQKIEILIKLCLLKDGFEIDAEAFKIGTDSRICGKIMSEFLPLDLRYSLINLETEEYILFSKYRKFDAYEFNIELPDSLDTGNYEFEIKSGRRHIATLSFTVVE